MQKSLLISHASHASSSLFFYLFFFLDRDDMTQQGFNDAALVLSPYLWLQTQVTSKEKVKIPKWFFLILPIATVFEVVSRRE